MSTVDAYPLHWPPGWTRTKRPQSSRFDTSFATARDGVIHELGLLGAQDVVLSSNVELRRDGLPYAHRPEPDDRGVAVYFTLRGEARCIPCDKWARVQDNLQAVRKTVEALRGLERWGAKEMVDAAFTGFKALPEGSDAGWWAVLEVAPTASRAEIDAAYRRLARITHPDAGGDAASFLRLTNAYAQATEVSR